MAMNQLRDRSKIELKTVNVTEFLDELDGIYSELDRIAPAIDSSPCHTECTACCSDHAPHGALIESANIICALNTITEAITVKALKEQIAHFDSLYKLCAEQLDFPIGTHEVESSDKFNVFALKLGKMLKRCPFYLNYCVIRGHHPMVCRAYERLVCPHSGSFMPETDRELIFGRFYLKLSRLDSKLLNRIDPDLHVKETALTLGSFLVRNLCIDEDLLFHLRIKDTKIIFTREGSRATAAFG